jgi:hypothetical protein
MTVTEWDRERKWFKFHLRGSVTGDDGEGDSDKSFSSKSGRISIAKGDYFVQLGAVQHWLEHDFKSSEPPKSFDITWKVVPMFIDEWSVRNPPKGAIERVTLFHGLENGPHTIEIIPNGDGNVPVKALVVHRPPM